MIRVKENINLDKLLDYGFRKSPFGKYPIYIFDIELEPNFECKILVNTIEYDDGVLRFYYQNDNDNNDYETIDYDIPIPDVIFKLIKDDIVEVIENNV